MSEVTMLSRMIASGLVCTFERGGDPLVIRLTVRLNARDHVYTTNREQGASALIVRAWRDWEAFCDEWRDAHLD